MAATDSPCHHCGTIYSHARLRCPQCHLPREDTAAPLVGKDRVAGLVLAGVGVVGSVAIGWWIFKTGFGRHAVLMFLPLWLLLHGTLLLAGIQLRDAYTWWNQRKPAVRIAIQMLFLAAFFTLVWFLLPARGR